MELIIIYQYMFTNCSKCAIVMYDVNKKKKSLVYMETFCANFAFFFESRNNLKI